MEFYNPHVFRDPTGLFSLTELTVSGATQAALTTLRSGAINFIRGYLTDRVRGVAGKILVDAIMSIIPGSRELLGSVDLLTKVGEEALEFEFFIQNAVCKFLGVEDSPYAKDLRLNVGVKQSGSYAKASGDGFGCAEKKDATHRPKQNGGVNVDFLVKKGGQPMKHGNPKAWLIGDVKASLSGVWKNTGNPETQLVRMAQYAKLPAGNMYAPVILYISAKGASAAEAKKIDKFGLDHGVLIFNGHLF